LTSDGKSLFFDLSKSGRKLPSRETPTKNTGMLSSKDKDGITGAVLIKRVSTQRGFRSSNLQEGKRDCMLVAA
jgi:hypothetical protein